MSHPLPRAPRSARVPFDPREHPADRHARRLREANRAKRVAREMIERLGGRLEGTNAGHWRLTFGEAMVEWWPQTGRVVFDRRYNRPRKAHDIDQLGALIERWQEVKR